MRKDLHDAVSILLKCSRTLDNSSAELDHVYGAITFLYRRINCEYLTCPRCTLRASYYDGPLGYEAINCYSCMTHFDLNSRAKNPLPIERIDAESSDVKSIGFSGACMEVEYIRSGVYRFYDVARPDYLIIVNAESIGRALRQMISKRKWNYEKK